MGKIDSKPTSYRFRDEARFALEELAEQWKVSKTAAIERLILAAHAGADAVTGEVLEQPADTQVRDPRAVLAETEQKLGVGAAKLTPESKYVREDGRPMNFFERKEVDKREHCAKKAAKSTSCDPGSIDFTVFDD